jgi:hypothetical protein
MELLSPLWDYVFKHIFGDQRNIDILAAGRAGSPKGSPQITLLQIVCAPRLDTDIGMGVSNKLKR